MNHYANYMHECRHGWHKLDRIVHLADDCVCVMRLSTISPLQKGAMLPYSKIIIK